MALYNGRAQIVGYVTPAERELIQRVAQARRLTVADLVSAGTLAIARQLADGEMQLGLPPELNTPHTAAATTPAPRQHAPRRQRQRRIASR